MLSKKAKYILEIKIIHTILVFFFFKTAFALTKHTTDDLTVIFFL